MKFIAEIDVMPLKALLDPQGKAVTHTLYNMSYKTVENVRIGKHISLEIEGSDETEAEQKVEAICQKVLSNPIMESYHFSLKKIS